MTSKPLSQTTYLMIAVGVFLLAFWLRTVDLNENSFWTDEGHTAQTVMKSQSPATFVEGVQDRLYHMPLYFASLLTYPGDHSDFSMRYPSVLWSMLAMAMMMRILTHFYHFRRYALLAAILFAVQSMMITQARTARMYPMGNFFVASVTYFFLHYLEQPEHKRRHWLGLSIVSLFAYLTHISTFIMIPAQGLTMLWQVLRRKLPLHRLFYWGATQALLLLPALIWIAVIFDWNTSEHQWIDAPTLESVVFVITQLFYGHLDLVSLGWETALVLAFYPLLLLIPALRTRRIIYWVGLTWVIMALLLIVSLVEPLFHERYLLIATFAYISLLVMGYKAIGDVIIKRYRLLGKVAMVFLISIQLLLSLLSTVQRYQNGTFATTFDKYALQHILQHAETDDMVIASYPEPLLDWYLRDRSFEMIAIDLSDTQIDLTALLEETDNLWIATRVDTDLDRIARDRGYEVVYTYRDLTVYTDDG